MGADSPVDDGCIFCRIISGRVPARMLSESETAIAFMDAFPLALGHVLVVPKVHRRLIQEMSAEEVAGVFGMATGIIHKTDKMGGATLLAVHNGRGAGQEIAHVHVHLVPRYEGDSAGPIHSMFAKADFTQQEINGAYDRLRI